MFNRQQLSEARSECIRIRRARFEERSRRRFIPIKMKGFKDNCWKPLRMFDAHPGSDDRAVTVPPQDCFFAACAVKEVDHFECGAMMKINRKFSRASGFSVSQPVGNQDPKIIPEFLDLMIERISSISPSPVEKEQRMSTSRFAVVMLYRQVDSFGRLGLLVDFTCLHDEKRFFELADLFQRIPGYSNEVGPQTFLDLSAILQG